MSSINLALVDDHVLFRKMLKAYLVEQPQFNVLVQASDIFDLFSKLSHSSVDILLLDIYLPELSGRDALNIIREKFPQLKIIVLSMCTDLNVISELLDAGIYGFVSKADEPDELVQAITSAHNNKLYRTRLFTEALYLNRQGNINMRGGKANVDLNEREKEIIRLLWEEKSNKEIANRVFLSVRSIEKIRQDIKEKIGVKSTIGLLKYAIDKNIIDIRMRRLV